MIRKSEIVIVAGEKRQSYICDACGEGIGVKSSKADLKTFNELHLNCAKRDNDKQVHPDLSSLEELQIVEL